MGIKLDDTLAFFTLSHDERRVILRTLDRGSVIAKVPVPKDLRSQAAACTASVRGLDAPKMAVFVAECAESNWSGMPDLDWMVVRFIYERMHEARTSRQVPGFAAEHLEVIVREMKAGSTPFEAACALWRLQRRLGRESGIDSSLRKMMPELNLAQDRLPAGVKLSSIASPLRRYEPVFVVKDRAYPVSAAWTMLPQSQVRSYVDEVGGWMSRCWPESIEACDDPRDHIKGYALDRRNTRLAAEAFARGYTLEEAAQFIFEQRIREEEAAA